MTIHLDTMQSAQQSLQSLHALQPALPASDTAAQACITNAIQVIESLSEELRMLQQALESQCAVHHIAPIKGDPAATLSRLLDINAAWALDPQISQEANNLVRQAHTTALTKHAQQLREDAELLPIGDHCRAKGDSSYNWARFYADKASKAAQQHARQSDDNR